MVWQQWIWHIFLLSNGIICLGEQGLSLELFSQSRITLDGREMRRYLRDDSPNSPLYRGFGTHFTYAWVGTPPRRVSLIVDTGSHYTAFPCKSCTNCGKHTDHYWDPGLSQTAVTLKCGVQRCSFSQSYTEGSSWKAYKVRDVFWIGGEKLDMLPNPLRWAVNFTFGCQTSETGLFRTQMENGIMGMSSDSNTLPFVLYDQNVISTTMFSLCLLQTGGVMSIGTINTDLHQSPIEYAALVRKSGYFTVSLETIFFKKSIADRVSNGLGDEFLLRDLNEPKTKYNTGKGIIIDSGTTDTYLPSSISSKFKQLFHEITGLHFSNIALLITPEQFNTLPTFVFRLLPSHNKNNNTKQYVDIEFPPKHYLEPVPGHKGKYIIRLYLTERSGGVIGANMMTGYNIIFDQMNLQVGFAKSHCKIKGEQLYDGITKPVRISRHLESHGSQPKALEIQRTTTLSSKSENLISKSDLHRIVQSSSYDECIIHPTTPCNAQCERGPSRALGKSRTISISLRQHLRNYRQLVSHSIQSTSSGYYAEGYQRILMNETCVISQYYQSQRNTSRLNTKNILNINSHLEQFRTCYIPCDSNQQPMSLMETTMKTPFCMNSTWKECNKNCYQSRDNYEIIIHKNQTKISYECLPVVSSVNNHTSSSTGTGTSGSSTSGISRKCSKEKCLFQKFSECLYLLQLTIPSYPNQLWSIAWKEELLYAMSTALGVDIGTIDIPIPPHDLIKGKKQIIFHLRVPIHDWNIPNFDLQTAQQDQNNIPKLSKKQIKCSNFPLLSSLEYKEKKYFRLKNLFLHHLYSIEYPVCGDWRWIQQDNLQITILQPESGDVVAHTNTEMITLKNKQQGKPFPFAHQQMKDSSTSSRDHHHLIDLKNPNSLRSLLYVSCVVLLTISLYVYYKRKEKKIREKLEKPRDIIEGRYRMVGYSR